MEEKVNEPKVAHHHWAHRTWIWVLGAIIVAFVIFIIGAKVGSHARKFVDTYGPGTRMMAGPGFRKGFAGMLSGQKFAVGTATSGTVAKISGNQLSVNFENGVSQTVIVSGSTNLVKAGSTILLSDIKVNDKISVKGITDSSGNLQAMAITVQ